MAQAVSMLVRQKLLGCTKEERLLRLLCDASEPLLEPSVRVLATFVFAGKGTEGWSVSLVSRSFFLSS
jgi:hypothetical protein